VLSGISFRTVRSSDDSGHPTWDEINAALRPKGSDHSAETGLICIENTHNFGGGSVMSAEHCGDICERAHTADVPVHIDGARIFNAAVAAGVSVADLTRKADSVQFCVSKGLGAPVGSLLVGSRDFVDEAHLWRKRMGGGMRQAGIIAAAGLIAIEESPKRLSEDHEKARKLAVGLAELPGVALDPEKVRTNIVIFDISATWKSPAELCGLLRDRGVLASGFGSSIRMVTHRDVSTDDVEAAIKALREVL
jgi:threonine aldolase